MCIAHAVGSQCPNNAPDVKLVQALLNENITSLAPSVPLKIDGQMSDDMISMIRSFQGNVLQTAAPDGRVDPGGQTLLTLRSGMQSGLTANKLQAIMLNAGADAVNRYFQPFVTLMATVQIDTPLRMAHFLAQVGHESGDLLYSEEIASGAAYEGRRDLGNTEPGDGPRFKGRGLIQLTGRANYQAFGTARGRDFVTPDNYTQIATDPNLAVDVSCWFWDKNKLNVPADADRLNEITRAINGGYNGLADRAAHLNRAKFFLVP